MDNLQRRPSGIYVARLTVPTRLRPLVGFREFVASTGTRSRAMAKLVASGLLSGWRRQLWELDRLKLPLGLMNYESILKLADGSPTIAVGTYLPIGQAAAALGLEVADLLRQAADGALWLYCRLPSQIGYEAPFDSFEPDDPEIGSVVVPTRSSMPREARTVQGGGIYRVPKDESATIASLLVLGKPAEVVAFEIVDASKQAVAFVPDRAVSIRVDDVELSCAELDTLRRRMAESIPPAALAAARSAQSAAAQPRTGPAAARSKSRLSELLNAFCKLHLPQVVTSEKEIQRMRSGIALLIEFEGDLAVGSVDADRLRHFRDVHLAAMPSKENLVRVKFGTTSMLESVEAVKGTDWPLMSANERDLRMRWIARMFRWAHEQKWIESDPCTGLRKESVLTKAQRTRAESERRDREAFTDEELRRIFGAPWFASGAGELTKAGTYRTFQPFHYWLPLLGLYTGARINELAQLYLDDVRKDGEVWYLDINRKSADKSLKNEWSQRKVPLHPKLVELGFTGWCDQLRREGFRRVFPELSWNSTNRYAKEPIRVMSQYLESLGMPRDGTKVFHSFRHGLNNALQKRTSMPDWMRKRFMGHEPGSGVNERSYLSDPSPAAMYPHLRAIEFSLPAIKPLNLKEAIRATHDALRRKHGGRGAGEAIGADEPVSEAQPKARSSSEGEAPSASHYFGRASNRR